MSEIGYVTVVNFERFQHYKDRNPPWIKLHASLLDDYAFARLQDASKMHLMGIWILASKNGNRVPADPEWIARRIGATSKVDLEVLIGAGFLARVRRASDSIADSEQGAMPETEERREESEERQTQLGVGLTVVGSVKPAKALTVDEVTTRLAQFLESAADDGSRRLRADEMRQIEAGLVFSYWAKKMGHERALLDHDRERKLIKRLEQNQGDVSELLYVVDGAMRDDWTMGRDPRSNKKFDGIETIYQDRAHVEKFAGMCAGYREGKPHAMAVKYLGTTREVA